MAREGVQLRATVAVVQLQREHQPIATGGREGAPIRREAQREASLRATADGVEGRGRQETRVAHASLAHERRALERGHVLHGLFPLPPTERPRDTAARPVVGEERGGSGRRREQLWKSHASLLDLGGEGRAHAAHRFPHGRRHAP